tara:strand:+ start:191 stop:334 length:144 start_codon:yes stop_codon:yes gene_type:complete
MSKIAKVVIPAIFMLGCPTTEEEPIDVDTDVEVVDTDPDTDVVDTDT